MTKYDRFFETIKTFAIDTNISTAMDFISAEETEILKLEENIDFRFNLGMRSYLKHFGHKIGIQNFDLTKFTISNILQAEENAKKLKIRDKVINGSLVDGWHGKSIANNLEQICFVNYFEPNCYFTFIDKNDEDSILYGWDGDEKTCKYWTSITSSLRGQIFTGLKYICDIRREKQKSELVNNKLDFYERTKEINIEGLKWLDIFKEKYIGNNLYVMSQHEFEKEIRLVEAQENRIIELVEYGEKFGKMLEKKAA